MKIALRILVNAAALWFASVIVPGIHAGDAVAIFAIALVFGIVNVLVRPVMKLLTCPIILLTLGLFALVVNALMLMLTGWIGRQLGIDFTVDGFLAAFLGALVISIVATILDRAVLRDKDERRPRVDRG